MSDKFLHIDSETTSELDLQKVGASRYFNHPSTKVLALAWAFNDGPVKSVTQPQLLPIEIWHHLTLGLPFKAWNAWFEANLFTNLYKLDIKSHQIRCTMQRSLYAGLPGKLEHAGPALGLSIVKDMVGHRLMRQMMKPRRGGTWWHEDPLEGPPRLADLADYCKTDVEAERAIGRHIPELPLSEQLLSGLDYLTNKKGIRIDTKLVGKLIDIATEETRYLDARCAVLTNNEVSSPGTQTSRLTQWLAREGAPVADLSKETIAETLETAVDAGLPDKVVQVLSIRQQVAKSSVRKLQTMIMTADEDRRVRGTLQYYGAGRTGRWSGRLIQPQNLPRPEKYANDAIRAVLDLGFDNEALGTFYGEPLSVVASCLRGCIIPGDGKRFFVFDLAQIEARVLAWLAGQDDVLDAFRRGEDVYQFTANKLGLGSRNAGKVAVLGLGYGMGSKAFVDFAKGYGLILSPEESTEIVYNWRDANGCIVDYWRQIDGAVRSVIRRPVGPGGWVGGNIRLRVETQNMLEIRLPSGRSLYYRNIRLEPDPNHPDRDSIVYDGVDQYTKKWGSVRSWGAKFVENVTQAVARDIIASSAVQALTAGHIELVLSVHDEVLFEAADKADFERVKHLVELVPHWAKKLPLKSDGAILTRYGKP